MLVALIINSIYFMCEIFEKNLFCKGYSFGSVISPIPNDLAISVNSSKESGR